MRGVISLLVNIDVHVVPLYRCLHDIYDSLNDIYGMSPSGHIWYEPINPLIEEFLTQGSPCHAKMDKPRITIVFPINLSNYLFLHKLHIRWFLKSSFFTSKGLRYKSITFLCCPSLLPIWSSPMIPPRHADTHLAEEVLAGKNMGIQILLPIASAQGPICF